MNKYELQNRTKQFALRVIRLESKLQGTSVARTLGNQILRSGTSVGANYMEACHARSQADFAAKIKICEAEAAETRYWIELLIESGIIPKAKLLALHGEASELLAIMSSAAKTARTAR